MNHISIKRWFFCVMILVTSLFTTAQAAKLEEVFNGSMLGVTQRYFESVAGIPIRKIGERFIFSIEGCHVHAFVKDKSVYALRLSLETNCQADLSFLGFDISTNKPTFGDFPRTRYFSDCLYLCGNAFDPSVYAFWQGSHANNFIEVMLETASGFEAKNEWRNYMAQQMGEDYVIDLRFNCEDSFSNIAAETFEKVAVESITIGHDLLDFEPLNSLISEYACGQ